MHTERIFLDVMCHSQLTFDPWLSHSQYRLTPLTGYYFSTLTHSTHETAPITKYNMNRRTTNPSGRRFDNSTGEGVGESSTSWLEANSFAAKYDPYASDALGGSIVTTCAQRGTERAMDGTLIALRNWRATSAIDGSGAPSISVMATVNGGIINAFPAEAENRREVDSAATYTEWDPGTDGMTSYDDLSMEKLDLVASQNTSGLPRRSDTEDKDYWRCWRSKDETNRLYMAQRQLTTKHVSAVLKRRPEMLEHMGLQTLPITGASGVTQGICIANTDNSIDVHCATKNHNRLSTVVTTIIDGQCKTCVPLQTAKDISAALRQQGMLLLNSGDGTYASYADYLASSIDINIAQARRDIPDPDIVINEEVSSSLNALHITPQSGGAKNANGSKLSTRHSNRLGMLATNYQAAQRVIRRQQAWRARESALSSPPDDTGVWESANNT